MIRNIKNKRAQHEIVGFVLIVVIVVIAGLFLLIFYLKQEPIKTKNIDVENFLRASMDYTTECIINEPSYESLEDLIKSCYENKLCKDGQGSCEVLNNTFSEMVKESWLVGEEKPVNSYSILIYYKEEADPERGTEDRVEEILGLKEGGCKGIKTGAETIVYSSPGNLIITMEICSTS